MIHNKKKILLPGMALLGVTTFAVIASNNVVKFIKVKPEERSYFLRMDADHNVFDEDKVTEVEGDPISDDGYQMPVKNDNGFDISFFFDDYFKEPEIDGFASFEHYGYEIHNLEPVNGIKSITIKYSNLYFSEGNYNPLLPENVELPPECVTAAQKKAFYCNYMLTNYSDWFDEDYTIDEWWNEFLYEERNKTVDGHYPGGINSVITNIKWGWKLEDLEDDTLPYYINNSLDSEVTFDFLDFRPNYFSISSDFYSILDEEEDPAIESIIIEYTCNECEQPAVYNNYDFTYAYHDDIDISDFWTDYVTGSYVEITGVKDQENIDYIDIPEDIDSYPVSLIGDQAFYGCRNLSEVKLPSSIVQIESNSFVYCESLETIELPEGLKVVSGFNYTNLSAITLPESLEIFLTGFSGTHVTTLNFPKNVKYISPLFDSMSFLANLSVDDENPYYTDLDGTNTVLQICESEEDGSTYYNVCGFVQNSIFKPGYNYLFENPNSKHGIVWNTLDFANITATIRSTAFSGIEPETVIFGPNISIEPDSFSAGSGTIKYIYVDKNVTLLSSKYETSPYYFDFNYSPSIDETVVFVNCDEGDLSNDRLEAITGSRYYGGIRYHKVVYLGDDATGLPSNYKELAASALAA